MAQYLDKEGLGVLVDELKDQVEGEIEIGSKSSKVPTSAAVVEYVKEVGADSGGDITEEDIDKIFGIADDTDGGGDEPEPDDNPDDNPNDDPER